MGNIYNICLYIFIIIIEVTFIILIKKEAMAL